MDKKDNNINTLRTAHHMEDNVCICEIYDTTYEEVRTALEQIEKETEERFDRNYPKPYPSYEKDEIEKYRNEVVYHSEIQNIGEKDGFCHFYITNEQPELIHGLLSHLNKTMGKAELIMNNKAKRPHAEIDYGVYVYSADLFESDKEGYEKKKNIIVKENNRKNNL